MSKSLVAFFSASGVTKRVSEKLANVLGAELFEIVPDEIYTPEDLDWQNKQSRSSVEMSDRASRPAISSKVDDISQYDSVFVGFPVWWYREPSIIDTFIESYDFKGITIVPFATSGGSDIGDSYKNIQELAPESTVVQGNRFDKDASAQELKTWATQWL